MQSSPRIDELRQKFHENPRRYFAPLANEYRKAGDPEQAIAICRAHLAQQPGHMSGHVVYGQALYDAKRTEEARAVFQQALALDPENLIVLRHLGDIARQRGDVEEARSWYSRALDGDPQDAEVAAYLAELSEPVDTSAPTEQVTAESREPESREAESREPESREAEPLEAQQTEEPAPELAIAPAAADAGEVSLVESPYADADVFAPAPESSAPIEESPYLEENAAETIAAADSPEILPSGEHATPEPETELAAAEPEAEPAVPEPVEQLPEAAAVSKQPRATPKRSTPVYENAPIITRTLAELYLKQGYIEAALDIYRQLAERQPDDAEIRTRISELGGGEVVSPLSLDVVSRTYYAEREESPAPEPASVAESGEASTERLPGPDEISESDDISEAEEVSEAEIAEGPPQEEQAIVPEPFSAPAEAPASLETPASETPSDKEFVSFGAHEDLWDTVDSWGDGFFEDTQETDEIFGAMAEPETEAWSGAAAESTKPEMSEWSELAPEAAPAPEPEPVEPPQAVRRVSPVEPTPKLEYTPPPEFEEAPEAVEPAVPHHEEEREITVREFFATLGAARPPLEEPSAEPETSWPGDEEPREDSVIEPSTDERAGYPFADDAFASLFSGMMINADDSRAAAALSGAVAHVPAPTPEVSARPRGQREESTLGATGQVQESEEDIRRFREWLEGLAES
jgi:tetratricopeptide (TPR) repeat protein